MYKESEALPQGDCNPRAVVQSIAGAKGPAQLPFTALLGGGKRYRIRPMNLKLLSIASSYLILKD